MTANAMPLAIGLHYIVKANVAGGDVITMGADICDGGRCRTGVRAL